MPICRSCSTKGLVTTFKVFNNVNTMNGEKKTRGKLIGFWPEPTFRLEVDELARLSNWTISDIMRAGVTAFWPDMRALVLAHADRRKLTPEALAETREMLALWRSARERGIDLKAALTSALEASLQKEAESLPKSA